MSELLLGGFCLLVPASFVALVVVLVVVSARQRRQRQEGLHAYAGHREWTYSPSGAGLEHRFAGDPFGRGRNRRAANAVRGRFEGRHFVAFDYAYVTSSGDDGSTTHHFSVVAMSLERHGPFVHPVPMLEVSPQGALGRFFTGLLGDDLVVGHPAFDDAFRVRTDSPAFARDVLHPGLTTMLATYQDRAWRLHGDSLLMFRRGTHSPTEIEAVLASMVAILDRVPEPVWARLRAASGAPGGSDHEQR